MSGRSGGRTSATDRDAARDEDLLERRVERDRAEERSQGRHVVAGGRVAIVHERGHDLGERGREARDRAVGAVLERLEHQRLRPDEQVEPLERVGFDRAPGRVRHLEAREVRRGLAEAFDHRHRDRVAGPARELVDVERQRSARLGRRAQVLEQRGFVEREVGRRDHGHRVGPDLLRVRRERDRVRRRLGSRVDRDLEAVGASLDEAFGDADAFGGREQDPLAGRAADERAVDAAVREEPREGTDGALVQVAAPVRERCHGGGDRSG